MPTQNRILYTEPYIRGLDLASIHSMDPLSVSASISGLISILDLIAGKSYKYVKEVRGSAQEVKKLVNEMIDLYGILNKLRLVVSRFDESISSTIQFQHIDTCRTLLDRIKQRLDKADRDNTSSQRSAIGRKISNLGRALVWPFSIGKTRALIDDVTTQKSTLMFALQVDGMNALFDALSDRKTQGLNIEAIRANVLGLRNEKAVSMLSRCFVTLISPCIQTSVFTFQTKSKRRLLNG